MSVPLRWFRVDLGKTAGSSLQGKANTSFLATPSGARVRGHFARWLSSGCSLWRTPLFLAEVWSRGFAGSPAAPLSSLYAESRWVKPKRTHPPQRQWFRSTPHAREVRRNADRRWRVSVGTEKGTWLGRRLGSLSKGLSRPCFDKQKQVADIPNMTFPSQRGASRVRAQVIGPSLDF